MVANGHIPAANSPNSKVLRTSAQDPSREYIPEPINDYISSKVIRSVEIFQSCLSTVGKQMWTLGNGVQTGETSV